MEDMDEVVAEFLVESYENLDRLDRDLVDLEQNPSADKLAGIFRTIHTIKGTSGFLGYGKLESITHVGENLLSRLRDGDLSVDAEITSGLLALVDGVRQILSCIEADGTEGTADWTPLVERLAALNRPDSDAPKPFGQVAVETGKTSPQAVERAVDAQRHGDPRHIGEILVEAGELEPGDVVDTLVAQTESRQAGVGSAPHTTVADNNIRVDVGQLDKLMNLVGELVLARNQILQFTTNQTGGGLVDAGLVSTSQRLNLITTELQAGVMKTRMQPIGNVWSKFPRVVRDLAVTCGKQVRIEMDGRETELDKTIIEAIKDPLTHLVRNAVDHGIESPDVRRAAGKPAEGRLLLRAFHESGQVNIEISDDGAGLDVEGIKRKAVERGIVTPEHAERMSDREATQLIFMAGFSTAAQVTNVSGRGVGMDVVKTHIEKIGGSVDLQSRLGHGTTLRIKIPLTLAIIPALVVTSGGDRYAIPQVNLLELVRLDSEQALSGIETIQGARVYRLRGNLLPIVYLHEELGVDIEPNDDDAINIVVLQADDRQFGLVVEGVSDTEEIVVKPLGHQLKGLSAFAGATIMGDGRVALILDVLGVAQQARVVDEVRDRALADAIDSADESNASRQELLLAEIGNGSRLAIPLRAVDRLEELSTAHLERAGGTPAVQYRDRILPLVSIARTLGFAGATPLESEQERLLQVVVHSVGDRSVGLVVERILD
ncbi:MAG TPA: chemotaxis protein CheA, partial [Acidimicrobiia bacterium]|nr:chemotaxis protein CheA [Acidimicrobiia bacterium]